MIQLLTFGKKKQVKNNIIFTEQSVADDIMRRAMINEVAKNSALKPQAAKPAPKPASKNNSAPNPHLNTIAKLNSILDKVSGYENSKITAMCELLIALESGNDQNLIKFLKTKDKVVKVKSKLKY
jgi:hypothetical protein